MSPLNSRTVLFMLVVSIISHGQESEAQGVQLSHWVKLNKHNVCFGTRDDTYGSFHNYAKEGLVAAIKLVYLTGHVRCANKAKHNSRWGCANHGSVNDFPLNIVGTDQNNHILFPKKEFIKYIAGNWYWLPFTNTVTSKELVFADLGSPFYFPLNQQMRIWYGEDLAGHTEGDNSGRVCVNVYAKFIN